MTRILEDSFISQVAGAIGALGYKVTCEPSRIPNRKLWHADPASLVRGLRYRPDILVEHDEKFVIVETKMTPPLLGSVIQARRYADYFGSPVIVCNPDSVFPNVPKSVREFADERNVRLCPLAEVGNALTDVLG